MVSGTWQVSLNIWWVNEPAAKSVKQLSLSSSTRSKHHYEADEVIPMSSILTCSPCVHLPCSPPDNLPPCSVIPRPAASTSPGHVLEMQIPRPHPNPTKSEALAMETRISCQDKLSRWLLILTEVWELLLGFLFLRITQACLLSRHFSLSLDLKNSDR